MKKNEVYDVMEEDTNMLNEQKNYWRNELSISPVVTSFPACSCVQITKDSNTSQMYFNITAETTSKIIHLANKSELGIYIILLTAVQYMLSVYNGSEEVTLGVPTYGGKGAIYPFKTNINYSDSFKEFLIKTKSKFLEISKNSALSYEELCRELGFNNHEKFLDTIALCENLHKNVMTDNLKAKVILIFNVRQGEIKFRIKYDSCLYTEDKIQSIGRQLITYLNCVTKNISAKLFDIDILSEEEKQKILFQFNNTDKKYDLNKTIHQLFEEQVERTPETIAIVCGDKQLTYIELNEKSNQLAAYLRSNGVRQNQIVGLMVERTTNMIIGMLAILKAGGAYLPIEPRYPVERIEYMLQDSGAGILLTFSHLKDKIKFDKTIVEIDNENIYKGNNHNLLNINNPKDLAYILYTSGSTGESKGVLIEHKSVNNLINALAEKIDFSNSQTILAITNITFDMSITETLLSLAKGLKVIIANDRQVNDAKELCKLISDFNIDIIQFTPSRIMLFLEYKDVALYLNKVRSILVGGESFSEKLLKKIKSFTEGRIYNIYGPTEITVYATLRELTYTDKINIGKPLANVKAYVLNNYGNLQPVGALGELYISGEGVARGYLNKEELTKERFIYNAYVSAERLYKTGDLVRWTTNGNIEYIGRADNQVKIRGYRIELGEIENQLLNNKHIEKSAVIVKTDEQEEKYLCGFIVANKKFTVGELVEFLDQKLPRYMIPSKFIQIDDMPLTSSGKTDRKALENLNGRMKLGLDVESAHSKTEKKLCEIWQVLLGIDKIGIKEDFFLIGGHSLKAAKLISIVYKEFAVELSLSDIFKFPTIKELALYIDSLEKGDYSNISPREKAPYYIATSEQKRIYAAHEIDNTGTSYNVPVFMEVKGKLDIKRLEEAFKKLINRHESLRTSFKYEEGELVQVISDTVDFKIDYQELYEEEIHDKIYNFIKPFDLSRAPLIRVNLGKFTENKYILMMDIHHIVIDGSSIGKIFYELGRVYEGKDIPSLKLQYKDYSLWQQEMVSAAWGKRQEEYWLQSLKGELPILNMPTDYPKDVKDSFEGKHAKFKLNYEITNAIKQICKLQKVTTFMVLLAAYNVLLSKYTNQEDIIIGTPVSGRVHPDLEPIIGMFVNSLPMRNYPSEDKSFKEFLLELKINTIKAFDNQGCQMEQLFDRLNMKRNNSGGLLFSTMFVFKNYEGFQLDISGLECIEYSCYGNSSKFDIALEVEEKPEEEEIECIFQYRSKVFKDDTIRRMCRHFINLLRNIIENPDRKISDLEMITEEEKNKILYEFNDTYKEYSRYKTIHELFEEQVEKTPNNIAVIFEDKQLTYEQLNSRANKLARTLRKKGVIEDTIVGIMTKRSINMIVAIMAILKAGGAYLPIDPEYPEDRIRYMLGNSKTKLLLCESEIANVFRCESEMLNLDNECLYENKEGNLRNISTAKSLAYIIYTSGSTGMPKGVMVEHTGVANLQVFLKDSLKISKDDRIIQFASYSFDGSVWEIFMALLLGGRLYIPSRSVINDYAMMEKYLIDNKITVAAFPPTYLINLNENEQFSIRKLFTAGSASNLGIINKWGHKTEYINLYGPTETTVTATFWEYKDKEVTLDNTVPIGIPINNIKIYILNKNGRVQPIGIPGEIYIAGVGMARGYLNQVELTKKSFKENPYIAGEKVYKSGDLGRWLPDGNIEFLGRIDSQVKIRGYRIELGEIENLLLKHPEVKEAVVIDEEDASGDKYLCAYIVGKKQLTGKEFREMLSLKLPQYMIPAYFMQLKEMPLTPNGKFDRNKLISLNKGMSYSVPCEKATNITEEVLVKMWQKIFQLSEIGINHNFFELGGHSLKAIELASLVQKEFKIILPISIVFKKQTIKELGDYIINEMENTYPLIEPVDKKDYYPASSGQRRMFILNQLYPNNLGYNVSDIKIIEGPISIYKVESSFKEIIRRHEALRTSFHIIDGEIVQKIHAMVNFNVPYLHSCGKDESELIKENIMPFDLSEAPLIRVSLIKLDNNKHMLITDTHHSISDGISMGIIMKEFEAFYNGEILPELKLQYKDYSIWQEKLLKSKLVEKQKMYWLNVYKNYIPQLTIPIDYPSNHSQSSSCGLLKFKGDSELLCKLSEISRGLGVNLFNILLSAYYILLGKICNKEDIVIGIPISGRQYTGTNEMIGMFVNTLAIRNYPKNNMSINEFIKEVHNKVLDAYENQDYQFDELVDNLHIEREYGNNTLFDTMFSMFDGNMYIPKIQDLTFNHILSPEEDCLFNISLDAYILSDEILFVYQYNKSLFKNETVKKFAKEFLNVLNCLIENGERKIKNLESLNNTK